MITFLSPNQGNHTHTHARTHTFMLYELPEVEKETTERKLFSLK